jgi:twinkle protein
VDREGVDRDTLVKGYKELFDANPISLYSHFGSTDLDTLMGRLTYMAVVKGCRVIVLDHITIAASGADNTDERRALDITMDRLRKLVEQTGIALIVVSHLKRPEGNTGFEDGLQPTLAHLRGSQAIPQIADFVIALQRDKSCPVTHNWCNVWVLKNRPTGEDGLVACDLEYDPTCGRYFEGVMPERPSKRKKQTRRRGDDGGSVAFEAIGGEDGDQDF